MCAKLKRSLQTLLEMCEARGVGPLRLFSKMVKIAKKISIIETAKFFAQSAALVKAA